jgi:biopolymer transport protein ExbB/TolQ
MDLIHQFQAGGFFMYFILFFGLLSIGIIVERTIILYVSYKKTPINFRHNLFSLISKGNYSDAIDYIDGKASHTIVGQIVKIGLNLKKNGAGEEEIQARMDEALQREISRIDKRVAFLSVFGNICTLFGLLGTVTGLIASFAGVASATPMERANLLSQGISEALNTTAFGLVMAIPALLGFAFLQNRTDAILGDVTQEVGQIFHDLLFINESNSTLEDISLSDVSSSMGSKAKAQNLDA